MHKEFFVLLLGFSLFLSIIPLPAFTYAEPSHITQIASEFLDSEYGKIDIINQQSYPIQDGPWVTEFVTAGNHDLTISAIDGTTFWGLNSDVSFVELYDGDKKLTSLIKNNKIVFPNYSSDGTGHLKVIVNTLGDHHLKFEFGNDVAYANNFASPSSVVEINDSTASGPILSDNDSFGRSVANIGDLNRDGVDDLAVGAYTDDDSGTDRGAVHIMFMNTDGSIDSTVEINDSTANGPVLSDEDFFGYTIANIGDLNRDGVDDLAVGAAYDDNSGTNRGAIHIMFMNTDGSIDNTRN
jgi:hypothetical protein